MKLFEGEEIIRESKNKRFKLSSHRLRYEYKSFFGSHIQSIMLEHLTSCELKHKMNYSLLTKALLMPVIINFVMFFINQYFVKGQLFKVFFGDISLSSSLLTIIFYCSLIVSLSYIIKFFITIKKVFSFHAVGTSINIEMRWLDFDERESFISQIENEKNQRVIKLNKS